MNRRPTYLVYAKWKTHLSQLGHGFLKTNEDLPSKALKAVQVQYSACHLNNPRIQQERERERERVKELQRIYHPLAVTAQNRWTSSTILSLITLLLKYAYLLIFPR